MAADHVGLHGSGELSSIRLIVEGKVHLWPTNFPDHRRRVVADWLLLAQKTFENCLGCG
jgi:hypothetical protein